MLLWSVIAALTAFAVLAVLLPLSRRREAASRERGAVAVYRDQLDEIDRDRERGLIASAEADAARTEIARRLIAENSKGQGSAELSGPLRRRRIAAIATLVGVPALALGLYAGFGSPDLPAQPLAARLAAPPETQDAQTLVARIEQRLAADPSDIRGWDVIAPVYLRMGRAEDAAGAFRTAIRLDGSNAAREAGLGEALAASSGGIVTDASADAFRRALEAEPAEPRARYYLALAKAQDGDIAGAVADWQALIDGSPADAPWVALVRQQIAALQMGSGQEGGAR